MSSKRPSRAPSKPPPPSIFPPPVPSEADETAMRMIPLFDRGRVALMAYVTALPPFAQPLGGARAVENMKTITAEDNDAQPGLVRRYVCANKQSVHILCEDGHLCSVHEAREIPHWAGTSAGVKR